MWCMTGTQTLAVLMGMFVSGFVLALALVAYLVTTKENPESQALNPPPW